MSAAVARREDEQDESAARLDDVSGVKGQSLRDCVRQSLERYFAELDGHSTSGLFKLVMAEVEAPLFAAVMRYTDNNQSKAAEILGINRGTLRKKLRQYDLE